MDIKKNQWRSRGGLGPLNKALEPTSLLGIFTISQFPGTVHLWENEGSNNVAICQSNISDAFLRPGTSSVSPVMVAAGTSDDTVLYRD